jgi:hypothetical protein
MAQAGFTPISIYYSSTSAAVPLAGNLAFGELALNILDGKLYYKSDTGVVTLLSTSAIAGGSFGALSYSTSFTGTAPATITDNSTSAALRVTQLGTGNAFVVEDSANPDASPFVIDSIGAVGIGGTPSTGVNLYNTRDLASATATAFGTSTASTVRSSVTTAAYGFSSLIATEAVAFTLPTLVHYAASQSTFANTAVTTQAGFQSQSTLIGAVSNFGFYAADTAAVTASKTAYGFYSAVNTASGGGTAYGIYAAGTAANVFIGATALNGASIHTFGNDVSSTYTGYFQLGGRGFRKLTSGNSIQIVNNANTTVTQTLADNGDFTAAGNVTAYSDIRLKKDLVQIPDALEKVRQLTGYTYTRIDTGEKQTGVVAQDVQKVLPEAVLEGEHLSVAYGNMVGLLIEAIKELEAQVAELRASK